MGRETWDDWYARAKEREEQFWADERAMGRVTVALGVERSKVQRVAARGYDLLVKGRITIEAKLRFPPHIQDVLLEIRQTDREPGWFLYSPADLLFYAWVTDEHDLVGHLLYDLPRMKADRDSILPQAHDFKESRKNKDRRTQNLALSIEVLADYELRDIPEYEDRKGAWH